MARARLYEPRPTGARRWARGVSLGSLAALPLVRFPVLISSLLRSGCIYPLECGDLALILLLVDMDIYLYTKAPCIGTKETYLPSRGFAALLRCARRLRANWAHNQLIWGNEHLSGPLNLVSTARAAPKLRGALSIKITQSSQCSVRTSTPNTGKGSEESPKRSIFSFALLAGDPKKHAYLFINPHFILLYAAD